MGKVFIAIALLLAAAGLFGFGQSPQPVQAVANTACQYPARSTNPPGGCDNTDPCDPQDAAKGGSGECAKPAETPPTSAPIETVPEDSANTFQGK